MKSVQGLLIAVVLGLAGAVLNWFYLDQQSKKFEKEEFIGIKEGVKIRRGETLRDDQLVKVEIPRSAVGYLKDFAYFYRDVATIIGQSPNRDYSGGELLMRQDMRTPPSELKLTGADECALGIPVDSSSFVPRFVVPGRKVSFIVNRSDSFGVPTPADPSETPAGPPVVRNDTEIIGPFRVLSVGNRLGTPEVMEANRISQVQENVITISVQVIGDDFEPKAKKLFEALRRMNNRGVGVLLHPVNERE